MTLTTTPAMSETTPRSRAVPATGTEVNGRRYDAIVVGSGWSGSLVARHLGRQGWRVLVLEAGNGGTDTWAGYQDSLRTYHQAVAKVPNSAYRRNKAAPFPDVLDLRPQKGDPGYTANGYFVQTGPLPYGTDYLRALGGAGMHWLGATPRMLPEDYATRTSYQYGLDWPIGAKELDPHLRAAEHLIGVAGDGAEQHALGVVPQPGYAYPMKQIPPSYQDDRFRKKLDGKKVKDEVAGGLDFEMKVYGLPQGRNSTPNPWFDDGKGYRPRGAVGLPNYGERCVGNASCVPICPVQAKSSPLRVQQDFTDSVHFATRCVVSRVLPGRGDAVRGVEFREYGDPATPVSEAYTAEADIVVLAAHSIQNAVILLASGMADSSGNVGRHLMDHPTLLAWARMNDGSVGAFRGPGHTSGLEAFRFGPGRADRAPFRVEIGNWGWGWSSGAPQSNVARQLRIGGDTHGEILPDGMFGPVLRHWLGDEVGRQVQLQIAVEQHANPSNRVTIDPRKYRDGMGHPRPVIHYDLDDHVKNGLYAARLASQKLFALLGATDHSQYGPVDGVAPIGHFRHAAPGMPELDLQYNGAGHGAGTHIMGELPSSSVVDSYQRTHDHPNLYAVGCGSMPSLGTSNPTLTMSALALRSAEQIHRDLTALHQPVTAATGRPQRELQEVAP